MEVVAMMRERLRTSYSFFLYCMCNRIGLTQGINFVRSNYFPLELFENLPASKPGIQRAQISTIHRIYISMPISMSVERKQTTTKKTNKQKNKQTKQTNVEPFCPSVQRTVL